MKKIIAILIFGSFVLSCSPKNSPGGSLKVGRFQIKQISDFRRDQYLIDTATGRLWTNVCIKLGKDGQCDGGSVWQEELVQNQPKLKDPQERKGDKK